MGQDGSVDEQVELASAQRRSEAVLAELRARGERVTRARRAVVGALADTAEHLSADELVIRAEAAAPGVHRATVYRALATLIGLGLVRRTQLGGTLTVYHLELQPPHEPTGHAHARCSGCGAVLDVPGDALRPLSKRLEEEFGFRVDLNQASLVGTCADCAAAGPSSPLRG